MSGTVRLIIFAGLLALAHCEIQSLSLTQAAKKKSPFKACIDDSDCTEQGDDFACFQYLCYPWKDDSKIPKEDKMQTCKSKEQCPKELDCHRHSDRRNIFKGLCMEPIIDCSENGESDCKAPGNKGPNRACCNGAVCCKQEYFDQLKSLPCVSHEPCRDMGYGQYCCPQKINGKVNETLPSVCCNENPNPPPPTTTTTRRPRTGAVSSSSLIQSSMMLVSFLMVRGMMSLRQ